MTNFARSDISTALLSAALLATVACGSSSPGLADGRALDSRGIDASSIDATSAVDASPTTISLTATVGGQPLANAPVLVDGSSGPQTQTTTDSNGKATVDALGPSNITVLSIGEGATELLTMNGALPGEQLTFGFPGADPADISVSIGGTPPNNQGLLELYAPTLYTSQQNRTELASDGTPTMISFPGKTGTTPVTVVALTGDGSQYVALPKTTYSDQESVTLPTNWMPTSTMNYQFTGIPAEVDTVTPSFNSVTAGMQVNSNVNGQTTIVDGAGTATAKFAPVVDQYRVGATFASGQAGQAVTVLQSTIPTSMTITGDQLAPWITAAAPSTDPVAINWSTTDSGGSAVVDGYIMLAQYAATSGSVTWYATQDPSATSWTLPILPDSLSMWSPVGASNFFGFPISIASADVDGYAAFRALVISDISFIATGNTTAYGLVTASAPISLNGL